MNERQQKWIDALRSDEYKQGVGRLKRINSKESEYCCLGVACDLAMKDGIELKITEMSGGSICFNDLDSLPPQEVVQYLGLTNCNPIILGLSLAGHNDAGKSFEQIADLIEANTNTVFLKEPALAEQSDETKETEESRQTTKEAV